MIPTKGPTSGTILQGSAEAKHSRSSVIQVAVLISPFASIGKAKFAFLWCFCALQLAQASLQVLQQRRMDKPALAKV